MKRVVALSFAFSPSFHLLPSALLLWLGISRLLCPLLASCGDIALPPASSQMSSTEKVERWLRQLKSPAVFPLHSRGTNSTLATGRTHTSHRDLAEGPFFLPSLTSPPPPAGLLPSASAQFEVTDSDTESANTPKVTWLPDRLDDASTTPRRPDFSLLFTPPGNDGRPASTASPAVAPERSSSSKLFTPALYSLDVRRSSSAVDSDAERNRSGLQGSSAGPAPSAVTKVGNRFSATDREPLDEGNAGHRSSVASLAASEGVQHNHLSAATPAALDGRRSEQRAFVAGTVAYDGGRAGHKFSLLQHAVGGHSPRGAAAELRKPNKTLVDVSAAADRLSSASILSPVFLSSSATERKQQRQSTWRETEQQLPSYDQGADPAALYTWPSLAPLQTPTSVGRFILDPVAGRPSDRSRALNKVDLPTLDQYFNVLPPSPSLVEQDNVEEVLRMEKSIGAKYPSDATQSSNHPDLLLKDGLGPLIHSASGGIKDSNGTSVLPGSHALPNVKQQHILSSSSLRWSLSDMLPGFAPPLLSPKEASTTVPKGKATTGARSAKATSRKEQRPSSWVSMKFLEDLPATAANTLFFSPPVNTTPSARPGALVVRADDTSARSKAATTAAAEDPSSQASIVSPPQQSSWQPSHILSPEAGVAPGGPGLTATTERGGVAVDDGSGNKHSSFSVHHFPLMSKYTPITRRSAPYFIQTLKHMLDESSNKQNDAPVKPQQQPATIGSTTQNNGLLKQTGNATGEEPLHKDGFRAPMYQQQHARVPPATTSTVETVRQKKVGENVGCQGNATGKEPLHKDGFRAPMYQQQHARVPPATTSTVETVRQKKVGENVGRQGVTVSDRPAKGGTRKRQAGSAGEEGEGGILQQQVEGKAPRGSIRGALRGDEDKQGDFGRASSVGYERVFFPFLVGQTLLPGLHQQFVAQAQPAHDQLLQRPWLPPWPEEDPGRAISMLLQQLQDPSSHPDALPPEAVPQAMLHVRSISQETDTSSRYSASTTGEETTYSTTGSTTTDTMDITGANSDATVVARQPALKRKGEEPVEKCKAADALRKNKERKYAEEKREKKKKHNGRSERGELKRHKAAQKEHRRAHDSKTRKSPRPPCEQEKQDMENIEEAEDVVGGEGVRYDAAAPVQPGVLPSHLSSHVLPLQFRENIPPRPAPSPAPPHVPEERTADVKEKPPSGHDTKEEQGFAGAAAAKPLSEELVKSLPSTGRRSLDGHFVVSTEKERLDQELGVRTRLDKPDLMHAAWKALKAVAVTTSSNGRLFYLRLTKRLPWSWGRYVKELPSVDDTAIPEFRSLRRQLAHRNTEVLIVGTPSAALKHLVATEHPDAVLTQGVVIKARVIDARRIAKCASEANGLMKIVPKSPFMLSAYGAWVSRPDFLKNPLFEGGHRGRGGNRKDDPALRADPFYRVYKRGKKDRKRRGEPMVLYVVTARARGDMDDYVHGRKYPINVEVAAAEMLYSLHLLHDAGFLHRDLKLMNYFVNFNGHVVLGDFDGIWPTGVPVSTKDFLLYTKGYLAPEVDINKAIANYTEKSDVYALGICYKELHEAKPDMQNAALFKQLYKSMTAMNPEKRPSTQQAMQHPFFKNINFSTLEQLKHDPPLPGDFYIGSGFYG